MLYEKWGIGIMHHRRRGNSKLTPQCSILGQQLRHLGLEGLVPQLQALQCCHHLVQTALNGVGGLLVAASTATIRMRGHRCRGCRRGVRVDLPRGEWWEIVQSQCRRGGITGTSC